jgi:Ca2+-binding RTX toxin-like protein
MVTFRDPLIARQSHFRLMGDINTIWNEYSGAGVSIGVYDDGVQYTHPDLDGNYDASLHFTYGGVTYDPTPITLSGGFDADGHGTSVSGLIVGEAGNAIGGVGVAWGARVTGVNLLSDPRIGDDDEVALASFRHAASFDIMNNSWGFGPYFYDFLHRGDPNSQASQILGAFDYAVENGRGGLGTIIVKAAGNEATNSNAEGLDGSRLVIAVSAITSTGAVTSYSNYGSNILVSAVEAAVTTDLLGADGYNSAFGTAGNYANNFSGTSAATPLVSGVVALMLDANENLGWRDVREILATSAVLTGSVVDGRQGFEVTGTYFQNGGFDPNSPIFSSKDTWNDGGRAYSADYGFGRVDAFAAVRMAEVWHILQGEAETSQNELQINYVDTTPHELSVGPLSGSAAGIAAEISSHLRIEHIDVTITVTDQYLLGGYLSFSLQGPDGTNFPVLLNEDDFAEEGFDPEYAGIDNGTFTWTFGISHALGLDAFGIWNFRFDYAFNGANTIGTVSEVKLDFFGSAWDNDNVHHITKDFLLASVKDAYGLRNKVLTDGNGGIDWINMSSIAGAVTITLDSLGKLLVAGRQWATIGVGEVFENLVTGDGADKITGSAIANEIHAMRGNDFVYGLVGDDTLNGGQGIDQLFGGDGYDLLDGGIGNDILDGGLGNDTIYGGDGADRIAEKIDGGNDVVYGGNGKDTIALGAGHDVFWDEEEAGVAGGDTVTGGLGNDSLFGAGGTDRLTGDAGDDSIRGGADNDTLSGGIGVDRLEGDDGNDSMTGGDGNDTIIGGAGNDKMLGDAGDDLVEGNADNDSLTGGLGNDTLDGGDGLDSLVGDAGNDLLTGGFGNDKLYGGADSDTLRGDGDNDSLYGGLGADTLNGGDGNDLLSGGDGGDLMTGGIGADSMIGDAGDDFVAGNEGNDSLNGGVGNDTLNGGVDNDSLTGGTGADTFVFDAGFGTDRVTDFVDNMDTLRFASSLADGVTQVADFVNTFARVVGTTIVFDFQDGNVLTVSGVRTLAALYDDVTII